MEKRCYNYFRCRTRTQKTVDEINQGGFSRKQARCKYKKNIDLEHQLIKDKLPLKPESLLFFKIQRKNKEKSQKVTSCGI